MRIRLPLTLVLSLAAALTMGRSKAQNPVEPDQNPTANTGALKAQITTAGSYDAHSGNATRIVRDLHVPSAPGVYGLDLTRYFNSLRNDRDPGNVHKNPAPQPNQPTDFGSPGWTHSWSWSADYEQYNQEVGEGAGHQEIYWMAITITFPDGHATKYSLSRVYPAPPTQPFPTDQWCGPPYNAAHGEANWTPSGEVDDFLEGMSQDGSHFWLHRADGGSVYFEDTGMGYQATKVYDPYGLLTTLSYRADGNLDHVEQDGGRRLNFSWDTFCNANDICRTAIVRVDNGASGTAHGVKYHYCWLDNWLTLTSVIYPETPQGETGAAYTYQSYTPPDGWFYAGPLLVTADDPHFDGPMTRIAYSYTNTGCSPIATPTPHYLNGQFDYFLAGPTTIKAEKSWHVDRAGNRLTVSSFVLGCFDGTRTEYNGLGALRKFFFGRSAGEFGDYHDLGFQLAKVTDFTNGDPATVPFDSQNYFGGHPRQIWDGRGIQTELVHEDGSGLPNEVRHTGSGGSVYRYDRLNPGASDARDPNLIHNPYAHWVFSKTDELGNKTTYTRDSRRRIKRIDYPDSSYEEFAYNELNEVTSHTLASVMPNGQHPVVHYEYDPGGRGLLLQEWNDVDGQANATIYTYDALDHVETVSHSWSRAKGALFSAKMAYNGRHQITSVEYPDAPQMPCAGAPPPPNPTPTATATATASATATATATATAPLPVADPIISPDGGSYPSTPATSVTITTTTSGADIRYTLDGSTPSEANGTLIAASSGTVAVTSSFQGTVVKAIAFKSTWITSAVKSSSPYTMPQVATPTMSPDGGTYPSTPSTTVTITTTTSGANIRYTLDGTMPTESTGILISSSSGTVAVTSTAQGTILKAIAIKAGCTPSTVKSSAAYTMPEVATPTISPDGGTYPSTPSTGVTITTTTSGANIRYTLDGTMPTESTGILISASSGTAAVTSTAQGTMLKAIAIKAGWTPSTVKSSAAYTMPQVAAPSLSPDGGTYPSTSPTTVTITTGTSGANIRYTVDGTIPTESNGTLILASSGTVAVTSTAQGAVLQAIAIKTGWTPSMAKSSSPFIMPQVVTPVFSPAGGMYETADPITVTVSTTTPAANIRYTVDGSDPTETHGTLIPSSAGTASVTPTNYLHGGTQLRAVAFKPGWTASAVHMEPYSVGDPAGPCYPVAYPGCDGGAN